MPTRVLVVDDSPTVLSLLAMGLGQKGYKVFIAENGADALRVMAEIQVDMVLTDMNMPEMDGLALVGRIRGEKKLADLPVIMLSSESERHDFEMGARAGVDLYLTKPIQIEKLDEELRAVLKKKTEANNN